MKSDDTRTTKTPSVNWDLDVGFSDIPIETRLKNLHLRLAQVEGAQPKFLTDGGGTLALVIAKGLEATNAELREVGEQLRTLRTTLSRVETGFNIRQPAEPKPTSVEDPTYGDLTWSGAALADPRKTPKDATITQMGQTNPKA